VDKPLGTFTVALIPHTLEATIAGGYRKGSIVNLEADVVARYVARNLRR
jgi:riboflavin synthase